MEPSSLSGFRLGLTTTGIGSSSLGFFTSGRFSLNTSSSSIAGSGAGGGRDKKREGKGGGGGGRRRRGGGAGGGEDGEEEEEESKEGRRVQLSCSHLALVSFPDPVSTLGWDETSLAHNANYSTSPSANIVTNDDELYTHHISSPLSSPSPELDLEG